MMDRTIKAAFKSKDNQHTLDVPVVCRKLQHSVYRHQNIHRHSMSYLCSALDVCVQNSDTLYSGHSHVCSCVFMFCVYPLWKSYFHFLQFHSPQKLFNTNHSWSSGLIDIRMSPLSIKHLFIFIAPSDFAHFFDFAHLLTPLTLYPRPLHFGLTTCSSSRPAAPPAPPKLGMCVPALMMSCFSSSMMKMFIDNKEPMLLVSEGTMRWDI